MIRIIHYRRLWLSIAGAITLASLIALPVFGLRTGIDFTGGSLLEIRFDEIRPSSDAISKALESYKLEDLRIQPSGAESFIIRTKPLTEERHQAILRSLREAFPGDKKKETKEESALKITPIGPGSEVITDISPTIVRADAASFTELRFESIGPSVGAELRRKAGVATALAIIAIIFYVAWAFRKVSRPVSSWWYGLIAIIALAHDVLLPLGVFAIADRVFDLTIDSAAIAAILTILGYSVNDTIVVFDRTREELLKWNGREAFADVVNRAVNQTIARSLNTTFTTLLPLLALLFFGGSTIRSFVILLTIGIASGAYSSIFIASPLLVVVERWRKI